MISKAFIQEKGNGRLGYEEQLVSEELTARGIPITFYTEKRIRRRQLAIDRESLVVGDMPCILGAIKQLGIPEPEPNDYPASLKNFMHRRIWKSTLEQLEIELRNGKYMPIFAKPATRRKRFTGYVFESEYDLCRVYGVSRQEPLLCSEVVAWVSEYRVYVVHSQIRSIDRYDGNPNVLLDIEKVISAIQALDHAGESIAGYAIDFGVLDSGETALVEMNDGFAIGAYKIDRKNYTDMILARWEELLMSEK
ncbi:ATP-grasp domain-containing protein [Calothrix sp. FACHB-1219]|uniref:ATP-grasp domain-containing protein n=1 Tax=unclassified Calothrix TaxID=2619626 RepID=UPI0016893749|nr:MULTISPECIES: ATP-grasp domain-containing protein [unclassified Calothrix]MBD2205515.1 ATP-grasp domain-containing protein [Calothrix sp. FACHB-168]MBD2220178.1 ATP-grasp domain-containing protein [Calothrix sp. FACHB-1219]